MRRAFQAWAQIVLIAALAAAWAGCDSPTQPPRAAPDPALRVRWTVRAGDRRIVAAPVVADGVAFVADGEGVLHALDLSDGQARWRWRVPPPASSAPAGSGGAATPRSPARFEASPLPAGGVVYVGDTRGKLHAIDARTGEHRWSFTAAAPIHAAVAVAGEGPEARVLLTDSSGVAWCLRTADGKPLWRFEVGSDVLGGLAVGDGRVYLAGCDSTLHVLDMSDGTEQQAIDLDTQTASRPLVLPEHVVIATQDGQLRAYEPGQDTPAWAYDRAAGSQSYASPAAGDGIVVLAGPDNQVHAADARTGQPRWVQPLRGTPANTVAVHDGRVYVAADDGRLSVFALADGEPLGGFVAGAALLAGPAVGKDSAGRTVIVLADERGTVYCLE